MNPRFTARFAARLTPTAAATTALVTCLASAAHAQDTPPRPAATGSETAPTTAAAPGSTAELESIVIRARRDAQDYRATEGSAGVLGDLKLTETPFSINVLTRQLLDNQQAAYYGDFLKNDPSASVGNVPVGFMTLRGFSVGTDGYLFDGLTGNVALSDGRWQIEGVDRIEVLKGPSAFLYGVGASTSLGGTVNFIPKLPPATPVRSLSLGYASQSLFSVAADLGDRFGNERQFGYRLNLGFKDGEQAVDHYDWRHQVATLALDWRATYDLLFTGGYEHATNRFPRLQPFYVLGAGLAVPKAPRADRSMAQPWDDFKTVGHNAYLRADWQIAPDWSLTAQALAGEDDRPRTKEARFGTIDTAAGDTTLFGSEDVSTTTGRSAQVLLHGKLMAGGVQHQLTAGLTATRGNSRSGSTFLGVFPSNLYTPVDSPEPPSGGDPVSAPTQKTRSTSLLLSDILKLDEQWSVLLAARRAKLTVDNLDGQPTTVQKTSPTAALMFKPAAGALLYLNYAQGLEPGGKAPQGATNQDLQLPPIQTEQIELGGKLETGGLTLTAALFDLRKPFEYLDPISTTYVQNGRQRHRGIEFTATGQATSTLTLVAGTMFLDAKTTRTGNPATEGKRPVGVPNFTANLYADWRIGSVPGLFFNGGLYHAGKQYLDAGNTQAVPAWTRFDLGARFETRLGNLRTAFLLGVENLADKHYWAGAQSGILTLAEPRTVKLTVNVAY